MKNRNMMLGAMIALGAMPSTRRALRPARTPRPPRADNPERIALAKARIERREANRARSRLAESVKYLPKPERDSILK